MIKFKHILGDSNICDRWSKFDALISFLNNFRDVDFDSSDKVSRAFAMLDEEMEEKSGINISKYDRLKEQILLLGSSRNRYSPELLILACKFFYHSPSSYDFVRKSMFLTLPNSDYIRKLTLSSNINTPGINCQHINYLKHRLSGLREDEKLVNVLLDEIHVKQNLKS